MVKTNFLIAWFFSPVYSFSKQQQRNAVSFGSLLRDNLISNSSNTDHTNTNKGYSEKNTHGWQYWCDPCACGFNKLKSYSGHISGKRHKAVIAESESLWIDYLKSGPVFYDPSIEQNDVRRAWSLDLFMDGLQARSRSSIKRVLVTGVRGGQLDPSLRLCDLSPQKRAALWRYLHTSGVPGLSSMVGALPPHYVRIKEVLESIEVFANVQRLMKPKGKKAIKISHIYDIGCGHGLVAMLCAATFPHISVHAIDIEPRESFEAQREAFKSTGTILGNLTFEAGDLSILQDRDDSCNDGHSLLMCVHGCKSLTHESIELAERKQWAWLSLPCCLQAENHLHEKTLLKLSDETRFAMLCGAITAKYEPQSVTTIDSRITARGIVLASSGKGNHSTS
mmetsp:Transcript_10876/g.16640  ORF Transcript_10876/g.16640 Transcript_10876/m.16640 type:complete len:393 (-) Transcript_10876:2332-3510(-)